MSWDTTYLCHVFFVIGSILFIECSYPVWLILNCHFAGKGFIHSMRGEMYLFARIDRSVRKFKKQMGL